MNCNLLTVVLITGVIGTGTLCAAETPAPAPKPTPAPTTSTSVTPPAAQSATTPEVPATGSTPEVKPGSPLTGQPVPVKPLTPVRPGSAAPEVQPPVKPGPVQATVPNQNDPLDKPAGGGFQEGPIVRPNSLQGFNNIDPINGRPITNPHMHIYGLLADPVPSTSVGSGDVVQQPLYLSFSSEDNLKAFQKADKAARQRYIEKARSNQVDQPRDGQKRDDQKLDNTEPKR